MDIATIIQDLQKHERALHTMLDCLYEYEKTGHLPPKKTPEKAPSTIERMTVMELVQLLLNNKPYISKYKNDAGKAEEVSRRKAENQAIYKLLEQLPPINEILQ